MLYYFQLVRIYCENDSCNKPRKYFWSDHNEVLCNGWFVTLHVRCKCDEIPDKIDVVECLEIAKTLFTTVNEKSYIINARSYIKDFDEEFQMYAEKLAKIDKRVKTFNLKSFWAYSLQN